MKRYQDKIVLVTASASGIGFGICQRLAEEGATVIISSRNQKNVDEAVQKIKSQGLKADGFVCHVGKKEHRDRLKAFIKEKFGRLDVLVLNAAVSTHFGSTLDTSEEQAAKMIDINIKSTFFMAKEYVDILTQNPNGGGLYKVGPSQPPQGNILIITSYTAYSPDTMIGIYSMTKTALLALTKVLAKELYDSNIRVNAIAPGLIRTKFAGSLLEHEDLAKETMKISRVGEPEDVAGCASFLCSGDASYITGETILVGGFVSNKL